MTTTATVTKPSRVVATMTEAEYNEHCESYDGVCLACGAIPVRDTEPDAEGYPCEDCGADQVQGIENALLDGRIEIT
jgi:hypothetical protein